MDRFKFAQCIKSEQNEDTIKIIGEIDTDILEKRNSIEALYYALPFIERMILEIFKLVPGSDIEYYQQGIMRTPIEIINKNNNNDNNDKIIPDKIVNIIEKYFKEDGIRNKIFHVEDVNVVIEGYFTDITYLIMELLQILKNRISMYKEFEIKLIEKLA